MVRKVGPAFNRLFTAANENLTEVLLGTLSTVHLVHVDEATMEKALAWPCSLKEYLSLTS